MQTMKSPRIVFMGTPEFAVESLDAILQNGFDVAAVVTVPDKPAGRGQKMSVSAVKEYVLAHNLPLLQPEKMRDEHFLEQLRALNADLFVVVAFRMLPQCVWAMPKMGTFNLHASLLPQYRGAAPINWAIINGETETGITTFLLNEHIDEGAILLQSRTPISEEDNLESVHDRLASMGRDLVVQTIQGLQNGTLSPQQQNPQGTLKPAPKIFKPDCAIDWSKKGNEIRNFVRGLSPYPAATMLMGPIDKESISFKIFDVEFEKTENNNSGILKTDNKHFLKIGISDGYISIKSLQMSGKKKNSIEEFLRGYNVTDWKLGC